MAGPDRLGRVYAGGPLRFTCSDCGHTGEMSKAKAVQTFGELATPGEVRERLRCSKCGAKRCQVQI